MDLAWATPGAIHLEVGQPDFDTPEHIVEATCRYAREGHTRYVPNGGVDPLREAAARYVQDRTGVETGAENILVTQGAVLSMATAFLSLTDPGDEVLLPDPGCEDDPDPCWDGVGIEGAEVRVATTDLGRQIFRMFYSGHRGGRSNLGFASSWDGLTWERFPYNPIVSDATDTQAPSNVLVESTYLLYFQREENARSQGIALGALETTNPTEQF